MVLADELKIGDKVVSQNKYQKAIGIVVKITPKRKDITVDFGNYTITFDSRGWERSPDHWSKKYIEKCTFELEETVKCEQLRYKCIRLFDAQKYTLTHDQVKEILTILNQAKGENEHAVDR